VRHASAARGGSERFAGIVASAMDGIVSADSRQRIVLFNPAAERIFGYRQDQVLGRPLGMLLPEPARAAHAGAVRRFGADGVTARGMGALGMVRGRRADGAEVPLEVSISRSDAGGAPVFTAIVRDISQRLRLRRELREAVERMRRLSRRLVEAQELEQRRISAELHDRIGQNLTALGLNLQAISAAGMGDGAKLARCLADSSALLAATVAAVRGLIAEVRPAALDEYGLFAGLRALAADFEARAGIPVELAGADPRPRLKPAIELALYRIAQEAINNAIKHARARRIAVRLASTRRGAQLTVRDDGRGFDVAATAPGTRRNWGLLLMQERAEAVGASLRVESAPGQGTRIAVDASRRGRAAPPRLDGEEPWPGAGGPA
jgi:PAS domain S-box-containing protein